MRPLIILFLLAALVAFNLVNEYNKEKALRVQKTDQLERIEENQIQIIENQWSIDQDSFHSTE